MHPRLLVFLFAALLTGCQSARDVSTDFDSHSDFSQYRSYHWASQAETDPLVDPLLLARLHKALEIQLLLAGLDPVKADQQADLLVRYRVIYKESTVSQQPSSRIGIGHSSGSYGSRSGIGISMNFPLGEQAAVGETTIVIELIEAASKAVKWQGSKAVTLSGQSGEQAIATVEAAVADILSHYPPL